MLTCHLADGGFCYRAGEVCTKLKRAAGAVAEAIGQLNQDPQAGMQSPFATSCLTVTDTNMSLAVSESWNGTYWAAGQPYSNQKRAVDDTNSLLDKILLR